MPLDTIALGLPARAIAYELFNHAILTVAKNPVTAVINCATVIKRRAISGFRLSPE